MTFIELVEKVAAQTGFPKSQVKKILHSTAETIDTHVVAFDGEIKWVHFGRFSQRKTRGGKAFGKDLTPRKTIKFTPYNNR